MKTCLSNAFLELCSGGFADTNFLNFLTFSTDQELGHLMGVIAGNMGTGNVLIGQP